MEKEVMTWEQLGEILIMLFRAFWGRKVELTGVPREVAQSIIKGDSESLVDQFLQFLANGGRVILGGLFKRITTVPVSGAKRFVAKDQLQEANIGWTGGNFKRLFLEKVEENVGDAVIAMDRLEEDLLDAPIRAELGDRAKIQLAHFFGLLKAQAKGEEGALLVNGCANIAYIRGIDGNFWAVDARWHFGFGCWDVGARSVKDPNRWSAGDHVLSCDS